MTARSPPRPWQPMAIGRGRCSREGAGLCRTSSLDIWLQSWRLDPDGLSGGLVLDLSRATGPCPEPTPRSCSRMDLCVGCAHRSSSSLCFGSRKSIGLPRNRRVPLREYGGALLRVRQKEMLDSSWSQEPPPGSAVRSTIKVLSVPHAETMCPRELGLLSPHTPRCAPQPADRGAAYGEERQPGVRGLSETWVWDRCWGDTSRHQGGDVVSRPLLSVPPLSQAPSGDVPVHRTQWRRRPAPINGQWNGRGRTPGASSAWCSSTEPGACAGLRQ